MRSIIERQDRGNRWSRAGVEPEFVVQGTLRPAIPMPSISLARAPIRPPRAFASVALALLILAGSSASAQSSSASDAATIREVDRVRLLEARRIARELGDTLWPGWSTAPFNVLLIDGEREFLLWHPYPPAGFTRVAHDSTLATDVLARKRVFPRRMDATFVITAGIPTVVIGTAESGGRSGSAWVLTLLHEHFHQLQMSRPDYNRRLLALELARGDSTGMWSLNYPFPYADSTVQRRFAAWWSALRSAAMDTSRQRGAGDAAVVAARRALREAVTADDDRYLDYQLWQEGISRYTELGLARLIAAHFTPSEAFRSSDGFRPFDEVATRIEGGIFREDAADLATRQREAFYPAGAALGIWLDRAAPAWRGRYLIDMFVLPHPMP